jgi:hypothetical protein
MGLDSLDIAFRAERQFGVRLGPADLDPILRTRTRPDMTAGELHDLIVAKCASAGRAVPFSSWGRVKVILTDALGGSLTTIRRGSLLRRDLGMD